jgi:hypothetical protein
VFSPCASPFKRSKEQLLSSKNEVVKMAQKTRIGASWKQREKNEFDEILARKALMMK